MASTSNVRPRQALDLHPYSLLILMYAGVFTSLTLKLGVKHLDIVEVYDIEPWAVDHLHPYGLVFCFRWRKDTHRPTDFKDPAAEHVWFVNQLSDDACASQAILYVLFNCSDVDIGKELSEFKEYTREMSPKIKGLTISNSSTILNTHNSLAQYVPLNHLHPQPSSTLQKRRMKQDLNPPPNKRAKTKKPPPEEGDKETYHFISYVPAYGKVWELDRLKSGPLEVTSLLAIVDDAYEKASDEWEYWKSEQWQLKRRLDEGWEEVADPSLLSATKL
ncbi:cysteine proteinase [Armillaria gallica]|uniref:ubiquitinyl hydrolase 1 n=1 Tax=Armillaria gallica TaxID=47427 RepID=A0A2H3D2F9_ARMGA|nr:cysteine proteinase [Armillaria gallica]